MGFKIEITKEDINRNIKLVETGQPLDIPLSVLNEEFKKIYYNRENNKRYRITERGKYFIQKWKEKNRERTNANQKYLKLKDKPINLRHEVINALWLLYFVKRGGK